MKKLINFEDIVGQSGAIRVLRSFAARNIVWKNLLFTGIDGTGKKNAAVAFAAACNCQNNAYNKLHRNNTGLEAVDACGICRTCRMIAECCHPDVLQMDFEDTSTIITISDIRNLLNKVSMKPYRSKHKVVIIPQAERMSSEVSNTFIKFLEEHNEQVTIILTAPSRMSLIPAVVSHCHVIRFKPIDSDTFTGALIKNNFEAKATKIILNLSSGDLAKTKVLSLQKWNDKRKWLVSKISSLCCNTKNNMDTREGMVLSEILSKCPDTINDYLTIIILWLRDVLIHKLELDFKRIYNFDMQESISMASENMDYASILNKISIVQIAQQDILKANVNLRLLTEVMLICIHEST